MARAEQPIERLLSTVVSKGPSRPLSNVVSMVLSTSPSTRLSIVLSIAPSTIASMPLSIPSSTLGSLRCLCCLRLPPLVDALEHFGAGAFQALVDEIPVDMRERWADLGPEFAASRHETIERFRVRRQRPAEPLVAEQAHVVSDGSWRHARGADEEICGEEREVRGFGHEDAYKARDHSGSRAFAARIRSQLDGRRADDTRRRRKVGAGVGAAGRGSLTPPHDVVGLAAAGNHVRADGCNADHEREHQGKDAANENELSHVSLSADVLSWPRGSSPTGAIYRPNLRVGRRGSLAMRGP